MFGMGMREMLLITGVMVLLFGAKKIPELCRGIGRGMKELRKGASDDDNGENDQT